MKISSSTERKIIYSVLFIAVALPLLFPIGWKTDVSGYTRMAYDLIEESPDESVVLISFDYDPSTMTEIQPMAEAQIEHAFKRNQRVIATALWPMGVQMAEQAFSSVIKNYPDKQYGIDYVNLGYKVGGMVTIQAMGRNLSEVYPADQGGTPYAELPMLKGINRLKDLAWISSLSSGTPGLKEWVMVAGDSYGVPVTGGCTAISAPGFFPYVNEQRQLYGLLGGLKAASEYEGLIDRIGPATMKMDAQSIAHLLILIFIAIGNVKAYVSRRRVAQ
ncbi:MAG: hypothetical protein PHU99_01420 [Candidatus Cloacimonetes bacterium]|jgi:hypothetical protein|nr:hypothetical protein [Candidatus Cloacimonadota bacterium]MDY0336978.1 hypothetical protein [Candidatus Cloacimonadaceae bacterium]MCB5269018.1 hypothetical protein [Candidatus Cloacimonadota bacterium]MCK9334094.1 hypothetical protein [Candidatus Cloacimonadota bacterium]MDD2542981.1 hypothetical protein [Candidatus Cloacimonadota bacterium]